jgi:adenylate cyclase
MRSLDLFGRAPHNGSVPLASAPASARRVLVIDDDVSVTDAVSRTLRLEGYEVWAAFSASEGLALARKHLPGAIVLDLRMPLASGLDVVRAIRAVPTLETAAIAVVTGDYLPATELLDASAALGAELRYKPVYLEELVLLTRDMLNLNRA